jgi:hypothetical protein
MMGGELYLVRADNFRHDLLDEASRQHIGETSAMTIQSIRDLTESALIFLSVGRYRRDKNDELMACQRAVCTAHPPLQ